MLSLTCDFLNKNSQPWALTFFVDLQKQCFYLCHWSSVKLLWPVKE